MRLTANTDLSSSPSKKPAATKKVPGDARKKKEAEALARPARRSKKSTKSAKSAETVENSDGSDDDATTGAGKESSVDASLFLANADMNPHAAYHIYVARPVNGSTEKLD
ncbi:hypothetical protein LTR22_010313 [Elasticomyces elasticus]|nr:hypothetical protein LTR22_010313 [Elasticomyces elasticus]